MHTFFDAEASAAVMLASLAVLHRLMTLTGPRFWAPCCGMSSAPSPIAGSRPGQMQMLRRLSAYLRCLSISQRAPPTGVNHVAHGVDLEMPIPPLDSRQCGDI